MKNYYVYIISNKNRTTLYIGVTNNLQRRIFEHKANTGSEFTVRYKLKDLLYYEECSDVNSAIEREKQLKNWHRDWKWDLIKSRNRDLIDLSKDWYDVEAFNTERRDPEPSSG